MNYPDVVYLHMALAALSVSGFIARALLLWANSRWLQHPLVKRAPHLVDTALLASGAWMAYASQQLPFVNSSWLSAKLIALLAYIGFGMLALRHGQSAVIRAIAFVMALLSVAVLIMIANQRTVLILAS